MRRRSASTPINVGSIYQGVIPACIEVKFQYDYDITYIDGIIRHKFHLEKCYRLPELEKKSRELQFLLEQPMTITDRENALLNRRELTEEIEIIKSKTREKQYLVATTSYLRSYKDDFQHVRSSVYAGCIEEEVEEVDERLIDIIHTYLRIASNYININVIHVRPPSIARCHNCLIPLSERQCNSLLRIICRECGAEQVSVSLLKSSKDKGSHSSRHKEDDTIDNFLKTWTQKQGKEIIDIPDNLYRKLDQYYSSRGMPTGAEVKLLPLNVNKKRGNTNHDMLHDALKIIKEPDYYKNMDYIGREYFGWENYDYEHLRPIVIKDYLETQAVYLSLDISFRERKSSQGTQFRLRKHLQMRGFVMPQSEFKIAKNPQSKRNHERIWKIMVEQSGNPEHRYIED